MNKYTPATLPALPRTTCPGIEIYEEQVPPHKKWYRTSKEEFQRKQRPCSKKPGPTGWCPDHQHAQRYLEAVAEIGYAEIQVGALIIPAGISSHEEYARRLPKTRLSRLLEKIGIVKDANRRAVVTRRAIV